MSRLYFTEDERNLFDRVLRTGLLHQQRGSYWRVVRLAVARSLQIEDDPDERFDSPGGGASELELEQITGLGKGSNEDLDSAMRLLLTVRHGEDLFGNTPRYLQLLQRHARRGLAVFESTWKPGASFHDLLLEELYADASGEPGVEGRRSPVAAAAIFDGLKQIDVSAAMAGEPIEGPRLTRHPLTLARVEDYERLRKGLDDLAFAIGLGSAGLSLSRDQGERRVVLDVPRPASNWQDVGWNTIRSALKDRAEALPVAPGLDILGNPFIFDFVETPHLFVAGATGSGKSVCLNAILLSLLAAEHPPELLMIDPKGVDFTDYDGCVRLREKAVITDMAAAVASLRRVVEEMEERQSVMRAHNARNLAEARLAGAKLERLVIVVDELADFMMGRSGAEEPLIRLAQKARATGIHLLLATQRPEAATFPGLLRANIPSRIALTVQKAADSRIILDQGGAEKLLMRGDMLVKLAGRDATRVHGARVEPSDIRAAVAAVNTR